MVARQRVVGERHLKLRLIKDGREVEAMLFAGEPTAAPAHPCRIPARQINEWNGAQMVQLMIEHWQNA